MKRDLEFTVGPVPVGMRWNVAAASAVTVAVLGILLVYRETVASIVAIWIRSETFARSHRCAAVPVAGVASS